MKQHTKTATAAKCSKIETEKENRSSRVFNIELIIPIKPLITMTLTILLVGGRIFLNRESKDNQIDCTPCLDAH
ncbi:Hypothetical protein SSA_1675 [Streptococcus sanguinis SK36]|uniref:Uncharacterized protein n=1 Tax=Streptococcus sanguinis (strain SK36) TaxID=388919 RepID=A3CPF5_STRSV|nr:Hypothetical protein SSA_1675 [Streptococcus sanguinis SK36]